MKHVEAFYDGHTIRISDVGDEDCSKAFHEVTLPNGDIAVADITPYDWTVETVIAWITAGYPQRQGVGPLHRNDLYKIALRRVATPQGLGTFCFKFSCGVFKGQRYGQAFCNFFNLTYPELFYATNAQAGGIIAEALEG